MFAILFEVLLIEIQEEIHHFAGWEGGGLKGRKIVNKNFVNKLAFPIYVTACCLAVPRPSEIDGSEKALTVLPLDLAKHRRSFLLSSRPC